jgi:hypothetical protein
MGSHSMHGELRNLYKILVMRRPLELPRFMWEDTTK